MKGFKGLTRPKSIDYQVNEWVKGNSLHNPVRDECCPDFSCCEDTKWTKEERVKFAGYHYNDDREAVEAMLFGQGIGGLLKSADFEKAVHIVGL